ncbi:MAG: hypothetical protein ABH952_09690 [Candidatus Omnitrophota bacterium]
MKRVAIVGAMMGLFLSACVTMIPMNEKYANELLINQSLAKHADYFKSKYAGTTKDEASYAYRAILVGELLAVQYDLALKMLCQEKEDKSIISDMKMVKETLTLQLSYYSEIWSKAINDHVRYEYYSVDFSTALCITKKEFERMEIFSRVETIKEKIKEKISTLDKQKFPKTYELYASISQFMALTEEPKGSLMTFNSMVNRITSDFSKILALAELEF